MKKRIACGAALMMMAAAGGAWGANKAETFSLTPFVGGYTFDGKQHLETAPVVGIRGGYNFTDHVGAEAAFDYVRTSGTRNDVDNDVYNYNLDLLYHFFPESRLVPFLMAGYGGNTVDPDQGSRTTKGAFNYGAGVKYALTEGIELRGEVRHLLFSDNKTMSNLEYGIGLGFLFGGAKPAPVAAAPAPPPPAPAPAPAPAPVVLKPACTMTAAPAVITQGESTTLNWNCQNATAAEIAGIGAVAPQGAKVVTPASSTSYTVTGSGGGGSASSSASVTVNPLLAPTGTLSVAPATVSQGDNTTLTWQCTNATSADIQPGLGTVPPTGSRAVTPAADTAYTLTCKGAGGSAASTAKVDVIPPEKLTMKLDVEFDTAKADIKKKYHDEIGRVAEFLKKYPTVTGTIEGHTDDVGDAAMNMKLSQRRADSVRKYLIDKYGIEPSRLTAVGYGETRPIADNKTAAGRQKNRRIQAVFETVVKKR